MLFENTNISFVLLAVTVVDTTQLLSAVTITFKFKYISKTLFLLNDTFFWTYMTTSRVQ